MRYYCAFFLLWPRLSQSFCNHSISSIANLESLSAILWFGFVCFYVFNEILWFLNSSKMFFCMDSGYMGKL